MTRLIVENVHRIPSRPWLLVTGRLDGAALRIGDVLTVATGEDPIVVRSIEIHGAPGRATVAVDAAHAGLIGQGTVLTLG